MKTLRKFTTAAVCLILILLCSFTAFAKTNRYQIKELNMSMEFPETMTVTTRETEGATLDENVYLSATDQAGALSIYVSMIENKKTQEIYSFANLTSEDIENYENQVLQNDEYLNCRWGTYGKVDFLDFSQKYTDGMVDIYGRQSITIINGMSIYITSQSIGDDFTTEELNIIKDALNSIKFKTIKDEAPSVNPWAILLWVVVILVVLAGLFLLVSFILGRQKTIEKRERHLERKRRSRENYDVLSGADEGPKNKGVRGFKTSGDYFDNMDSVTLKNQDETAITVSQPNESLIGKIMPIIKTISLGAKTVFTRLGYFFKNLSRMVKNSSKKSGKNKKRSKQVRRGASKEYDVFRDR